MRKRMRAILLTGTVAVLAVGLTATSSSATTLSTWSVSPGGTIALKSGKVTFEDTTDFWSLHCTSSKAAGTLRKGTTMPGYHLGVITSLTFTNCTGPGKARYTITASVPLILNGKAYDASKAVATLDIAGFRASFSATGCKGTLGGTSSTAKGGVIRVRYTDNTGDLGATPNGDQLHSYGVTGCDGLFKNGDAFTLTGTYAVSPKQIITSTKVKDSGN